MHGQQNVKIYSVSHKIYQSKSQRDLVVVQYPNVVHDLVKIWIYHKLDNTAVMYLTEWISRLVKPLSL